MNHLRDQIKISKMDVLHTSRQIAQSSIHNPSIDLSIYPVIQPPSIYRAFICQSIQPASIHLPFINLLNASTHPWCLSICLSTHSIHISIHSIHIWYPFIHPWCSIHLWYSSKLSMVRSHGTLPSFSRHLFRLLISVQAQLTSWRCPG